MDNAVILAAGAANPLLPNWWEVLVTLVGFLVLLIIINKVAIPMFEKTFEELSLIHI